MIPRRKLIEIALPLDAINKASAREKSMLFDRHKLPGFHDPFAGGGALPHHGPQKDIFTPNSTLPLGKGEGNGWGGFSKEKNRISRTQKV